MHVIKINKISSRRFNAAGCYKYMHINRTHLEDIYPLKSRYMLRPVYTNPNKDKVLVGVKIWMYIYLMLGANKLMIVYKYYALNRC